MKFSPEEQERFINKVLEEWASDTLGELQSALKERFGFVPTETLEVLKFQLFRAASGRPATAMLNFQDSGRINEMRQIEFRKAPITREENFILEWVKKRGVEKFKSVPGYPDKSRIGISKEKQASRIASAIIFSKVGKVVPPGRQRRKRRWYNTEFYSQVEVLVKKLIREQGDFLLQGIKDETINLFKTT